MRMLSKFLFLAPFVILYSGSLRAQLPIPETYTETLKWRQVAAKAGNVVAQYQLGKILDLGLTTQTNKKQAAKWYSKAAAQGHVQAQIRLAQMYYNGEGVEKNLKRSAELYGYAAVTGAPLAQFNYAAMLEAGAGIKKNIAKAAKFYKKAANARILEAQVSMAMLYARGEGVNLDPNKAMIWLEIAIAGGASVPKNVYESLRSNLAPSQWDKVKRSAKEFINRNLD